MHQQQTALENIVGKGEIAGYQHFLHFPQCLLPFQKKKKKIDISVLFILSFANAFNLDHTKNLLFSKELKKVFFV